MTNYRRKSVRCIGRAGGTGAAIYRGKQQMNRISLVVLAAGALTLTLFGCGSGDDSADASGLRKGTPSSSAPATTTAPTSSAAPTAAAVSADITCTQFKSLDADGEKKAIEEILAENPGGPFDGSPNVALGTVKLVCLVPANADKPVADAAGMKP
ncbi:hypothetical protein ACTWPB_09580 [Nocardia sp. IBHARD005]|uniref:hypothetical protein n=1 Tax=Nocardia sp. IBHARD005 TaxID=3457765 RepID=UPI00405A40C3